MGIFNTIKDLVAKKEINPSNTIVSSTPHKKILIVEDDQYLRDFYQELLKNEGFDVTIAENGQVGLEKVTAQKPDLILLDLMMPVMDGKTMLHKVRDIPECKTTPVIILTNAGDTDSIRETKFYDNANDFLIKSNINPQDIITKVKTLI